VNPLTFLPARELPLAPLPDFGDPAPTLSVELEPSSPSVVTFLRHTGCPFAEQTMRMLRGAAHSPTDVQWVAVSHAPADATKRWCEAIGGCDDVRVLSDPQREIYAAWGLGRTSLGHFLGRRSLAAVGGLARQGIRNRHPHGTRWQSAGAFALDPDRVVRWRHVPAHAGDLPDLNEALNAIA
jgi:hypothetical protein